MKRLIVVVTVLALVVIASGVLIAQGKADRFYASSERFGYIGTVSVYDTWADANSGRNARCTVSWPQQDGAIFSVRNVPDYYFDFNSILTNWFADNGHSPSDTNFGFFQMYDDNADVWQNQKAFWSRDLSTFTVVAKGRNATYGSGADPRDHARLWNACAPLGSGETTAGTFLRYEYSLTATGLQGVKDATGFVTNTVNASDYSGYFKGVFLNESKQSPASNGYYVFTLTFNKISWAAEHNCGWGGPLPCGGPALNDQFGGKIVNAR